MVDERPRSSASARLRRRGPRSYQAILRRSRRTLDPSDLRQPRGGDLCQSGSQPPSSVNASFALLLPNIRGFISHRAELEAHLILIGLPNFVALTETFLNPSIDNPSISGHTLISRRDRPDGRQGGIVFHAQSDSANCILHCGDSLEFERSWHVLHSEQGPISIALWYRPPAHGEVASILSLPTELNEHASKVIGTMIVGDMNVHHKAWLHHSSGISPEGRELFTICAQRGLVECVQKPTRGLCALDLVLSDFDSCISTEVLPQISDHQMVLSKINLAIPQTN